MATSIHCTIHGRVHRVGYRSWTVRNARKLGLTGWVRNTTEGTVVIVSDNMYLYENLERQVPIAQTLDAASNLAAQRSMTTIATSPRLIVPGHDPAVFTRFTVVLPGVVRIR